MRNIEEDYKIRVDRAMRNSRASVEQEGLEVSISNDSIVRDLLSHRITDDEANRLILLYHGITEDIINNMTKKAI